MARIRGATANPKAAKKADTVRWTIDIPAGLDFRLTGLAKLSRSGKQAFAIRLLDQGCGQYKADKSLKTVLAEIQGEVDAVA